MAEAPRYDTLDDILDVAHSVIEDYGADDGRIARMALWIAENLGSDFPSPVWMTDVVTNDPAPVSKTGSGRKMTSNEARRIAASLLRAADNAEK